MSEILENWKYYNLYNYLSLKSDSNLSMSGSHLAMSRLDESGRATYGQVRPVVTCGSCQPSLGGK
jgi:hypothetical protein